MERIYYKIIAKEERPLFTMERYVYDTQDIIKTVCDLVNGYSVNPDNITVETYINGKRAE